MKSEETLISCLTEIFLFVSSILSPPPKSDELIIFTQILFIYAFPLWLTN